MEWDVSPRRTVNRGRPEDRREAPRRSPESVDAHGEWDRVVDISTGGACLERDAGLEIGTRLCVFLTDEAAQHTVMLDAEVVWQHGRRVGLRWVDLDPPQQRWLAHCCQEGSVHGYVPWLGV